MAITRGMRCAYCMFVALSPEELDLHYDEKHLDKKEQLRRTEFNERIRKRRHEETY